MKSLTSDEILAIYQVAQDRCKRNEDSAQDALIVSLFDSVRLNHAKIKEQQNQLDKLVDVCTQSSKTITDLTLRLSGAPKGAVTH